MATIAAYTRTFQWKNRTRLSRANFAHETSCPTADQRKARKATATRTSKAANAAANRAWAATARGHVPRAIRNCRASRATAGERAAQTYHPGRVLMVTLQNGSSAR